MSHDKPRDRPTVPDVLPLVAVVYARHCAGCCAHILVDDGNVDDESAAYCLQRATEQGHADCIALCTALAQMTTTQRRKVYRHNPEYASEQRESK